MGKRNNRDATVGRRRPMIQLGGSTQKTGVGSVSRSAKKEEETVKIEKNDNQTNDHIDSQLAGFLAEINSLDTTSEDSSSKTTEIEQPVKNNTNLIYDPVNFDPATQSHLLPAPWQACYDDSTAYYYYWNTETNEVQWYPPVFTVSTVPPPPPPEMQDNTLELQPQKIENNSENNEILSNKPNNDDVKLNSAANVKSVRTLDIEDSNNVTSQISTNQQIDISSENETKKQTSKDEDRMLMNQIKEKIRRKKEEKMLKEKEEQEKAAKELEEIKAKEKEDLLREKLIKKKLEREKTVSPEIKDETETVIEHEVSLVANKSTINDEGFALDIFASEDANASDKTEKTEKIEKDTKMAEIVDSIENQSEIEQPQPPEKLSDRETTPQKETEKSSGEVVTKEPKVGWRIIDAVYDDAEDDDNDKDSETNEGDGNNSEMEIEKSEGNAKSVVEIDDYAEMLLEGAIGTKEDTEPSVPPVIPPPPPDHDVRPPLPLEDEPLPELPKVSAEEEESLRKEIGTSSTEIFEKLDFLGINNKDLRNLQIHFIELETRMKDWQAGALDSKYLVARLHDLNMQILKHEETAAPAGWLCHWSSNFKMYYYHNTMTGESQWEYPEVSTQVSMQPSQMSYAASYMQAAMVAPMINPMAMAYMDPTQVMPAAVDKSLAISASAASLVSPAHGFSREPIPKESKKRTASSEQEKVSDPYTDPYRIAKKKKKESSQEPESSQNAANISGTASPVPKSIIAAAPLIRDSSREASPSTYATPPRVQIDEGVASPLPPIKRNSSSSSNLSAKAKMKKKKKVDTVGLPSKKLKHVSSLVQKWQTVKQKVEEEENIEEESEDEDFETQSERRIAEWKKDLEASGKMEHNPNFMEIQGNWRERLKRKTTT